MPAAQPILFTPGPVRTPPSVARALAEPPCNYHRQAAFSTMMASTDAALKRLLGIARPDDYLTAVMTATGTGVNEGCLFAMAPLGRGLVVTNGFFGARWVDQVRQDGIDHEVFEAPSDRPLDPDAIGAVLDRDPSLRWVFFVSHETRAGLKNPFEAIGRACRDRGRVVAADAISSAYAYPIDLEASGVDLLTASSAKAIMAAPGLGIVFIRKGVIPTLRAAAGKPRGYYQDVLAEAERQAAERQPRFAQPVVLHAALAAACTHLEQVGVAVHMARIQRQMQTLITHLATLGVQPLLDAAARSNIAVNFRLPPHLPYAAFSKAMEAEGFYCLYGIPGDPTHFQLSTIGDLSDQDVTACTQALSRVLGR